MAEFSPDYLVTSEQYVTPPPLLQHRPELCVQYVSRKEYVCNCRTEYVWVEGVYVHVHVYMTGTEYACIYMYLEPYAQEKRFVSLHVEQSMRQ